jgi:hypothetical protein
VLLANIRLVLQLARDHNATDPIVGSGAHRRRRGGGLPSRSDYAATDDVAHALRGRVADVRALLVGDRSCVLHVRLAGLAARAAERGIGFGTRERPRFYEWAFVALHTTDLEARVPHRDALLTVAGCWLGSDHPAADLDPPAGVRLSATEPASTVHGPKRWERFERDRPGELIHIPQRRMATSPPRP